MKKTVLRALCAVIALILVVSLTGCGVVGALLAADPSEDSSSETSADPTPTPEPASAPTPGPDSESPSKEPAASGIADGMYATVREFMADNREVLNASIEQLTSDQDDMTVSLEGTTDRLIYKFVFTESAMDGVDEQALIDALEEGLADESFVATFENIADSVKSVVAVDSVKIDVIYYRYDGKELASRTFTSSSAKEASAPETTGSGAYDTVRDYLDDNRDYLDDALSSMVEDSDEISSLTLDATDDTLIYRFILDESALSGLDETQISASLNSTLNSDTMVDYFGTLVSMIKSSTKLSSAKVMLVYAKADGTILASREYSSK